MTEGIGKALASAIKEPAAKGSEKRGRHIFRNQHRRDVFSMLTRKPCLGVGALARELGLSVNTVKWHVDCLVGSGYLVKHMVGKHAVFFPDGLVSQGHAGLFHSVNHPGIGTVYGLVLRTPGLSQTDVAAAAGESRQTAAKVLTMLDSMGLLTTTIDGAHSRYYPTRLMHDSAEDFYNQSKRFSEYILKKLEQEGGKPPAVVKRGLDIVLVEMGYASDRFTIEIGINPFMTCAVC